MEGVGDVEGDEDESSPGFALTLAFGIFLAYYGSDGCLPMMLLLRQLLSFTKYGRKEFHSRPSKWGTVQGATTATVCEWTTRSSLLLLQPATVAIVTTV